MGNYNSVFSNAELNEYEELTFLTKREIYRAWDKWREITESPEDFTNKTEYFSADTTVLEMRELKYNPFKEQIALHFGEKMLDGRYYMNFENFLDLLHVMSPRAPLKLKSHYAFKIFDLDGDEYLDKSNLNKVLDLLTGETLEEDRKNFLTERLLHETDMEGDGGISEEEFKHLLTKCPDFIVNFRLTI